MAKLLNQAAARKLMEADGWVVARGGKHVVKMTKPGMRPVTLPFHGGQAYGKALSAAIRKQAGLDD
ncbi:MAG: type II toxin-antitoxin system HicA family toxin [Gaiellaceae bacterium]